MRERTFYLLCGVPGVRQQATQLLLQDTERRPIPGAAPPHAVGGAARARGPEAEDPVIKARTLSCYLLPVSTTLLHSDRLRVSGGPKCESSLPEVLYTTLKRTSLHKRAFADAQLH